MSRIRLFKQSRSGKRNGLALGLDAKQKNIETPKMHRKAKERGGLLRPFTIGTITSLFSAYP